MTGKVILFNGASSAGKSSIARAVQDAIGEPFLRYGFDHLRESGVLPLERFRRGHAVYDLELDSLKPPAENAQTLLGAWRGRTRPSAFDRTAAAMKSLTPRRATLAGPGRQHGLSSSHGPG